MRLIVAALALLPGALGAQQIASSSATPPSARATATAAVASRAATPPVLDGRADDAAWQGAQVIDQFLEYDPDPGAESRFRTELRVTYDDRYLYILGRMYDPAPDSIVSLLSRRDVRTESEQLKLVIDSYHDRRTAYQFIVNPAGVKRDFYVYNDATEDASWDAVWDVATRIDSLGWVAEFRIPFSQLRFNRKAEHTFGLLAVRDIARTRERLSWPLYRRDAQGYVSQAGEVGGIVGIGSPRRLEIAPYVVTKNVTEAQATSNPGGFLYDHPQEIAAGADLKYGLTSNLTLDATINPDFGQVEADPAVLNLGAFEQFFEERRPFFLEGTGIFTFRTYCDDIDTGCRGLFYSRRIGRSPQLGYLSEDGNDVPDASTILGAAKLTGRLGRGTSVGALAALTQEERGTAGLVVEPRSAYVVGRVLQDLNAGRTSLGAMVTGVDRSNDDASAGYLRDRAYTAGLDFRHRFWKNNYEMAAMAAGSVIRGSADAIARAQLDGVHRYQRPDDDVAFDPTRTSLTGDGQRVSLSKFGGGITRFQSVYQRYSPGFELNDVGFLARADEQLFRNWFSFNFNTPRLFYRRAFTNFNTFNTWTTDGMPISSNLNTNWHVEFKNTWWGHIGGNINEYGRNTFDDRVARGGPALRRSPSYNWFTGVELDRRKAYTPVLFTGAFRGDEGRSHGWWLEPSLQLRAASQFSASVGIYYEDEVNDDQWVDNFGDAGNDTTHYTFARLEQTTLSINTRLNWTATPNLSLQVFAQPFISTGEYTNWRELADPRAEDYDARFRSYAGDPGGFRSLQFRSNSVLRWEYRPGSTLFLVWQQGRDNFEGRDRFEGARESRFRFRSDSDDLFGLHPNNTLLLKVSYWFNP